MSAGRRAFTEVATGTGTVTVRVRSGFQNWTVSQVSTKCDAAPIGALCEVNINGDFISKMLPAGDVASGDPPVDVGPNDTLNVVWRNITAGATCTVTVIYDDGM